MAAGEGDALEADGGGVACGGERLVRRGLGQKKGVAAGTFGEGDDETVDFGVGACLVDLGVGDRVSVDTEEEVFTDGA